MLPLKDFNPTSRRAVVTLLLIAGCIAVFFLVQPVGDGGGLLDFSANRFTYSKAAIPDEVTTGEPLTVEEVLESNPRAALSCDTVDIRPTGDGRVRLDGDPDSECFPNKNVYLAVLTSMFLHGSLGHLAFNMLFLWIFGNNIEDRWGHALYGLFYVAAGVVATLAFVLTDPGSATPLVGASGAIAGIMGSYLVLFPNARILGLLGFFPLPLKAKWFLLFWFATQFLGGDSAVAYAAHIGGFVFGIAVGAVVRAVSPPEPLPEPAPAYEQGYESGEGWRYR